MTEKKGAKTQTKAFGVISTNIFCLNYLPFQAIL